MALDPNTFADLVHVPFGYLSVRVPRDPRPVLIQLYGPNYMTPPPENQRKPLHLDR